MTSENGMVKILTSAEKEIEAPYTAVRDMWHSEHALDLVTRRLDTKWSEAPVLIVDDFTPEEIDVDLIIKTSRALIEFMETPQNSGKKSEKCI